MTRPALVTFAKAPVLGHVKTRLQPSLGPAAALELHEAMLADAVERMERLRSVADPILAFDGVPPSPPAAAYEIQDGSDLGARLRNAFERRFDEGYGRVCIVGIDSPMLDDGDIERAFAALTEADVVLGPCHDGGYYLIGLKAPAPALFEGIPWGSDGVLAATLAAAERQRLSTHLLPPGFDVDRPDDLRRLAQALQGEPLARERRHTGAWVARTRGC